MDQDVHVADMVGHNHRCKHPRHIEGEVADIT